MSLAWISSLLLKYQNSLLFLLPYRSLVHFVLVHWKSVKGFMALENPFCTSLIRMSYRCMYNVFLFQWLLFVWSIWSLLVIYSQLVSFQLFVHSVSQSAGQLVDNFAFVWLTYLSICKCWSVSQLSVCYLINQSVRQSVSQSVSCLLVIPLFISLSYICLSVCMSVCMSDTRKIIIIK